MATHAFGESFQSPLLHSYFSLRFRVQQVHSFEIEGKYFGGGQIETSSAARFGSRVAL